MPSWSARLRGALEARLWPVPVLAVVLALGLGLGLPELDAAIDEDLSDRTRDWIFGGDAAAARSLLDAIASSLITVTALTFSLTVVTLQLASSQFSPRLLRTFTSDRFVQVTLALFLATFTYALTVLRAVRSAEDGGGAEFVPRLAVSVGFVLAIASVLGLVLFLAHLTSQIRVETMLRNVRRDASGTLQAVLSRRSSGHPGPPGHPLPQQPPDALRLSAHSDGFLVRVDHDALLEVAVQEEVVVVLDVWPGTFLVVGTPVGAAWPLAGGPLDGEKSDRVSRRVAGCVRTGVERTSAQDVGFGLRQVTDVATKALSPGINDPTTAVHALGHISALLCELADHDLDPALWCDAHDRVRVVAHRPDLAAHVDAALSQPRRYGAQDPEVLARVTQVLLDLGHRITPEQAPVVLDQLVRVRATAAAQSFDPVEREALASLDRQVVRRLDDVRHGGAERT